MRSKSLLNSTVHRHSDRVFLTETFSKISVAITRMYLLNELVDCTESSGGKPKSPMLQSVGRH